MLKFCIRDQYWQEARNLADRKCLRINAAEKAIEIHFNDTLLGGLEGLTDNIQALYAWSHKVVHRTTHLQDALRNASTLTELLTNITKVSKPLTTKESNA